MSAKIQIPNFQIFSTYFSNRIREVFARIFIYCLVGNFFGSNFGFGFFRQLYEFLEIFV
jgi:hypothetical protein